MNLLSTNIVVSISVWTQTPTYIGQIHLQYIILHTHYYNN